MKSRRTSGLRVSDAAIGRLLAVAIVDCVLGAGRLCGATGSAQAKALFKDPPREYSTGPLWVWNDMLTEGQVRETLRDLAAQKVKQVWVHPRPGLTRTVAGRLRGNGRDRIELRRAANEN